MKDFARLFSRRYSAVNPEDEQPEVPMSGGHVSPTVLLQRATLAADMQRRKSLKANRSMNPAGILSSFFNERQSNKRARSPKCAFLLLAIGVLAITTAVLVKIFKPYDLIFKWKLVMEEDGEIFNLWAKPPVDLYIKIYLFNITNAEAFLAGRERMNVEQVGPYVYKEIMTHENISFNPNNTISTNPSHPLVWQEHMSEGRQEDDEVVMLNIAMLAISHLTAKKSFFVRMALNTLFATSKSSPIVRMTAKEFMFGYQSSLTTLGNTFLPNWISFEKVGLIDRMYDFASDYETFHTGVPNPGISGLYATYRGDTNLPHWHGESCSNIELASDGTKFKSFLQPNETVKFFRKSMCRPINLHRVGESEKYGSLSGYKYVFEENAFDNGVINEQNKCFCRNGLCQPQGLIDVTDCYYGFPISLSYPHFMEGEYGLTHNITGLTPNKSEHSSAFVIQPESGMPLSLSVKVQINMHFNDMSPIKKVSRFSDLTAPMLWFEIMMPKLPPAMDTRFNFYLNILPYLDVLGFWGGLVLGIGLLVYAVTRATIRMSTFAQSGHHISESGKYCKANLLRSAAAHSSVYRPCEMKLIQTNEKEPLTSSSSSSSTQSQSQHLITRNDEQEDDADLMYSVMRRQSTASASSAYALELEPALSLSSGSESSDEGNESESSTTMLSRNSTECSCMDAEQSDSADAVCSNCEHQEKQKARSFISSSSSNSIAATKPEPINRNNGGWSMGAASSLIEDIGNATFDATATTSTRTYEV